MKQESVKLLQNTLDGLIKTYNNLLRDGKYNEALNVMKNVEMVIRQLKELGITTITEEKAEDKFLDWYNVLKFFIETKQSQLIKLDNSSEESEKKHRGTGKTTTLCKLSNDFGIPIYTSPQYQFVFEDRAKELGIKITTVNHPLQIQDEIILVDEASSLLNKDKISGTKNILIGFTNKFI